MYHFGCQLIIVLTRPRKHSTNKPHGNDGNTDAAFNFIISVLLHFDGMAWYPSYCSYCSYRLSLPLARDHFLGGDVECRAKSVKCGLHATNIVPKKPIPVTALNVYIYMYVRVCACVCACGCVYPHVHEIR